MFFQLYPPRVAIPKQNFHAANRLITEAHDGIEATQHDH